MISCEKIEIFCNLQKKNQKKKNWNSRDDKTWKILDFRASCEVAKKRSERERKPRFTTTKKWWIWMLVFSSSKKNITYIKKSAIDKKTNFKKPKMMRKWIQQHTTYCTTNYTEQLWSSIDAEINNHCFAWKKNMFSSQARLWSSSHFRKAVQEWNLELGRTGDARQMF